MTKHFDTLEAAKLSLTKFGYKEISPGLWSNGEFKATIHPAKTAFAVFWSVQ